MVIGNNNIDQMELQKKEIKNDLLHCSLSLPWSCFSTFWKKTKKNEFSVICSWFNFIDLFFPYIDQYN